MPEDYPLPHETRTWQVPENPPSLRSRLHLGRAALAAAVVEIPAVTASVVTGNPDYAVSATGLTAIFGGATLYEAHNYIRNGLPIRGVVARALIKR